MHRTVVRLSKAMFAVATALLILASVASLWIGVQRSQKYGVCVYTLGIGGACVTMSRWEISPSVRALPGAASDVAKFEQSNFQFTTRPSFQWKFSRLSKAVGGIAIDVVWVPLWPLIVGASVITGFIWWRRRMRPFTRGRCDGCGYSLTGLTAGAACPECGHTRTRQT